MSNLAIKEDLNVCDVTVPNINGGFGGDKKAMMAKHIAKIHGKSLKKVNELINENKTRFKNNVDIMDLKQVGGTDLFLEKGVLTQAQIGNAKNLYLLSERGYAKLIKLFNDEKSWDLYDQMLDEYFDLRDGQQNNKPQTSLEMLQSTINQMVQQEQRLTYMEESHKHTENKVTNMQNYLTETPDRKKVEREINAYARRHNMKQADVRTMVYKKIEDRYGFDVMTRVNNKRNEINKEKVEKDGKAYATSTLKQKYNGMDLLVEEDRLRDVMEILAGME